MHSTHSHCFCKIQILHWSRASMVWTWNVSIIDPKCGKYFWSKSCCGFFGTPPPLFTGKTQNSTWKLTFLFRKHLLLFFCNLLSDVGNMTKTKLCLHPKSAHSTRWTHHNISFRIRVRVIWVSESVFSSEILYPAEPRLKSALRPPPSARAESANFRPFYVKRADFSVVWIMSRQSCHQFYTKIT